jgi:hypothetical protein
VKGINELHTIENWIAANRIWLIIAVSLSFTIMIFSLYYITAIRQPATAGATAKPLTSNISTIKPIQQTSLQVTSLSTNNQPAATSVKINNQPVDMPANGVVHQVVNDTNGTTTIDVSSDSKSSGTSSSNSSMNIQVNSVSQSSSSTESNQ